MDQALVRRAPRRRHLRWRALLFVPVLLVLVGAAPAAAAPPTQPSIVGGTAVPDGKYRFQAALLGVPFGDNDYERQFCGGSLITPWQVLTAAHCVDFIGSEPDDFLALEDLRVVVGRTVLTSHQGQRRRAVDIAIHPRWDPFTIRFDAAIITLNEPVETIDPIRLPTPHTDALEQPGRTLWATGWGNTIAQPVGPGDGGVNYPNRLREVKLTLLSRVECATSYTIDGEEYVDVKTMLCAGRTGKDTCQGDSGGPLFMPATGGGYIQLGITSWGAGCAAQGFPGVYARLSNRGIGNFILEQTGGIPVP